MREVSLSSVVALILFGCAPSARPAGSSLAVERPDRHRVETEANGAVEQARVSPRPPGPLGTAPSEDPVLEVTPAGTTCRTVRPDLTRPFLELSLRRAIGPAERSLLRAWLREEASEELVAWEAAPCHEQLLCGAFAARHADELQDRLDPPSAAAFYRSREAGIEAFIKQLKRPDRRQVVLAELLLTTPAPLSGAISQVPQRVTYGQLKDVWESSRSDRLWTVTTSDGEAERSTRRARAAPLDVVPKAAAAAPVTATGTSRELSILVDRDSSLTSVLLLWELTPRADLEGPLELLPEPGEEAVRAEVVLGDDGQFLGLRLTADREQDLTRAVVALLSPASDTQRPPQAAHPPWTGRRSPRDTLDRRCTEAFTSRGSGALLGPPGVVVSGVSEEQLEEMKFDLGHGRNVLWLEAEAGDVKPFAPRRAPTIDATGDGNLGE